MRLVSWNVNGIRAAWEKGLSQFLDSEKPDILCLQETKIQEHHIEERLRHPFNYESYWSLANKAGYSGVATFSKTEPLDVIVGLGGADFDSEGRTLTLEFPKFFVVNAYFPNSQRDHARLPYKLAYCAAIEKFLKRLEKKGKAVILCGDYNIAHREIDLRNPKTNKDNAGFLPEERAWMDCFLSKGYVDTFRMFESGEGHYTWWSYRPGVREKNIGWRIDYHCINEGEKGRVKKSQIHPDVRGSDHCPISIELA